MELARAARLDCRIRKSAAQRLRIVWCCFRPEFGFLVSHWRILQRQGKSNLNHFDTFTALVFLRGRVPPPAPVCAAAAFDCYGPGSLLRRNQQTPLNPCSLGSLLDFIGRPWPLAQLRFKPLHGVHQSKMPLKFWRRPEQNHASALTASNQPAPERFFQL